MPFHLRTLHNSWCKTSIRNTEIKDQTAVGSDSSLMRFSKCFLFFVEPSEILILWTANEFKNSIFVGFHCEKGDVYEKSNNSILVCTHFSLIYF